MASVPMFPGLCCEAAGFTTDMCKTAEPFSVAITNGIACEIISSPYLHSGQHNGQLRHHNLLLLMKLCGFTLEERTNGTIINRVRMQVVRCEEKKIKKRREGLDKFLGDPFLSYRDNYNRWLLNNPQHVNEPRQRIQPEPPGEHLTPDASCSSSVSSLSGSSSSETSAEDIAAVGESRAMPLPLNVEEDPEEASASQRIPPMVEKASASQRIPPMVEKASASQRIPPMVENSTDMTEGIPPPTLGEPSQRGLVQLAENGLSQADTVSTVDGADNHTRRGKRKRKRRPSQHETMPDFSCLKNDTLRRLGVALGTSPPQGMRNSRQQMIQAALNSFSTLEVNEKVITTMFFNKAKGVMPVVEISDSDDSS